MGSFESRCLFYRRTCPPPSSVPCHLPGGADYLGAGREDRQPLQHLAAAHPPAVPPRPHGHPRAGQQRGERGACPAEPAQGSGQAQDPAQQGLGVTLAWRRGSPTCRLLSAVGSVGRAWREGSEARTRRGIAVSPPLQ